MVIRDARHRFMITSLAIFNLLITTALSGCIVVQPQSESGSNNIPRKPQAVQRMESKGYTFTFDENNGDLYWGTESGLEGWAFRIYEDGVFGMSGEWNKDYDAQTEASIDFFESLGITPDQASFTNLLVVEAMGDSEGKTEGCDLGLCCQATIEEANDLYMWMCER